MKFEAAQIHFLGDVFAPVAVLITWWLSDRVANRYYMIGDFSQVEVFKISFQNNIGILSFILTIRAFHLQILYWRRYIGM